MDWKLGPPVLVGEKVLWPKNDRDRSKSGIVKWIGKIPDLGPEWNVGIELDEPNSEGLEESDGFLKGRKLFECHAGHGLLVPLNEIQKLTTKGDKSTYVENYSDLKLDESQIGNSTTHSNRKNQEIILKDELSALGSESVRWSLKNPILEKYLSGLEFKKKVWDKPRKNSKEFGGPTKPGLHHDQQRKSHNAKSSLRKKRKKIKSYEIDTKTSENNKLHNNVHCGCDDESFDLTQFKVNEAYENPTTLYHKENLENISLKTMNEVAGYFKEIKEDESTGGNYEKPKNDYEKQLEGILSGNIPDSGHAKEKKFFSFLKWFKKNKDDPNLKNVKPSSATSSPMFVRRRDSSCESLDTVFSTQTVRSFAYIPPTLYRPSAPPSSLVFSSEENVFESKNSEHVNPSEEPEPIYDKKKKRKAPDPPRLLRENSLPTTLEHKKNDEFLMDGIKTYHRRTVSESFKDKKAGAYCHVQGKRKAPLPPLTPILYPNLQKLNNPYPSLYKKKKPAPLPPIESKSDTGIRISSDRSNILSNNEKEKYAAGKNTDKDKCSITKDGPMENEEKGRGNAVKDISLSPLPSRPWYKRSHRDSGGLIKKDLLKGFEKKKNKETEECLPEVGFSRKSFSTDGGHKFNIFSRLEKNDDKKKEEKRKSQISILTNISELDREAAEIVRKEQLEENKKMADNDAKFYCPEAGVAFPKKFKNAIEENRKIILDDKRETGVETAGNLKEKVEDLNGEIKQNNERKKVMESKVKEENQKDKKNYVNLNEPGKEKEKLNASSGISSNLTSYSNEDTGNGIGHFKVANKQVNYLNEPWVCQKCTLENPGWRVFCEICSSVKPRFLVNFQPKIENQIEKTKTEAEAKPEDQITDRKPENSAKQISQKPNIRSEEVVKESNGKSNIAFKNELKEDPDEEDGAKNDNSEMSMEELRRKRLTFYTSKLENLCESNDGSINESDKVKLKKILKEMKDSLSETRSEGVLPSDKTEIRQPENGSPLEENKKRGQKEKFVEKNANAEDEGFGEKEKHGVIKKKPDIQYPKKEEIAEAYLVTKTIVLEDVIVKKAEKGSKVSAAVQTKSSFPNVESEIIEVIRPPPRTKKNVTEASTEPVEPPKERKKVDRPSNASSSEEPHGSETRKVNGGELEELTRRLTRPEGVADFRANLETMPANTEMNTVAVNRLLRRLEQAINEGEHYLAAGLAKELALMKINCSVTRQVEKSPSPGSSKITIDLYVEDKVSHQGPIPIRVSPSMTLLQLKKKIQQEFNIPIEVQRWILGKRLAVDDDQTLESDGVTDESCPVFLYLVAPGKRESDVSEANKNERQILETKNKPNTDNKASDDQRTKGWYYNYEEDHYSYCEDSDESEDSNKEINQNESKSANCKQNFVPVTKFESTAVKVTEKNTKKETRKPEKSFVLDLKMRESETELEKELKLISVNSVKQKIEQLNRSFAENNKLERIRNFKLPETWRCVSCNFVNTPGKLNCSSCNAKKVVNRVPFRKDRENQNEHLAMVKINTNRGNNENFHYKELMELQDADLVPNIEPFNCPICLTDYKTGEGVTLKDCLHTFCRTCLVNTVQYSEDAEVKCPYLDDTYSCKSVMQQREIKALVPRGIFELHLAKSVKEAENKIENAFHCKTPDCKGWCIYEDNVNEFRCPVCKFTNCLTCQAIHSGINCRQYQERMKDASETDADAKKTKEMLEEMVEKGEAMACPKCQVVLMKKWGCDWLRCSMCKTEICWVTRGFRWGPAGKGDTSGGCRCGVNGIKCHPKCNYCH